MKGLGQMVAVTATYLLTLACQGCVSVSTTPAAMPSAQTLEIQTTARTDKSSSAPTLNITADTTWTQTDRDRHIERLATPSTQNFARTESIVTFGPAPVSSDALTSIAAERVQEQLTDIPRDQRAFNGEIALSAPAGRLDVGIAPRFSITQDGAFSTRRVGGELRIGQNFDRRGEGSAQSSWYLFAGADGEALVWEPDPTTGNIGMSVNDMALRDKVTVGDMQAGVSVQRGSGELSFSYIRREVEYRERNMGASEIEDFAGISFTIKR
ncbi:MAG: hypothetical protein AAGK66_01940 [Pseudomonadota bacterium]